jgi:hypothetical protein
MSISLTQLRAQYDRNATSLRMMFDRAERTGKKVNGYTAGELEEMALQYENIAAMDDAELREYFASAVATIRRPN